MTKATENNSTGASMRPNRRTILTGTAAALAAGTIATMPKAASAATIGTNPDAELIAACDRFTALEHEKRRIYATAPNTVEGDRVANTATAPLYEEQDQILDRVQAMDAKTWDGLRARLRMAFSYGPKCTETPTDWDDCIAGAILDDAARLLGVPTDREGVAS